MILNGQCRCRAANGGSILIIALWVIFMLATLAVAVGAHIGGRLALARKIEQRTVGYYAARTGVERSLAILQQDTNGWDCMTEIWADSPKDFSNIVCGAGAYSVSYSYDRADGSQGTNFGMWDEQAKLDLNLTRVELLVSFLQEAGGMGAEPAARLADAMVTARTRPVENTPTVGEKPAWIDSRLEKGPFHSVAEVRWVKGMTDEVFAKIRDHVTVHGGTRVNLNTADKVVLRALARQTGGGGGSIESLTRKILQFRQTGGIFKTYLGSGVESALGPDSRLTGDERARLNGMVSFVTVVSDHFRGHVEGKMAGRMDEPRRIDFVWDRKHKRIEFWYED